MAKFAVLVVAAFIATTAVANAQDTWTQHKKPQERPDAPNETYDPQQQNYPQQNYQQPNYPQQNYPQPVPTQPYNPQLYITPEPSQESYPQYGNTCSTYYGPCQPGGSGVIGTSCYCVAANGQPISGVVTQ